MTIDVAINRNKELIGELIREGRLEKAYSVQLAIEALKFRQAWKEGLPFRANCLLPGETKE